MPRFAALSPLLLLPLALGCGRASITASCSVPGSAADPPASCVFSNLGSGAGAACVTANLLRVRGEAVLPQGTLAVAGPVCSGRLPPGTSVSVPLPAFSPAVADVCGSLANCNLDVEPEGRR